MLNLTSRHSGVSVGFVNDCHRHEYRQHHGGCI